MQVHGATPRSFLLTIAVLAVGTTAATAQIAARRNNPYSPSPNSGLTAPEQAAPTQNNKQKQPAVQTQLAFVTTKTGVSGNETGAPVAPPAVVPAERPASSTASALTSVYRIGIGDVLFINIKNTGQSGQYCTVRGDGSIDFPLASGVVRPIGMTIDELQTTLARSIKLYPDPQLDIKVREYNSHKIMVTGLVQTPGQVSLQREAMPLFAIKAQTGVEAAANAVKIVRAQDQRAENYLLSVAETDNILIYSGDRIEFIGTTGKTRSNP